MYNAQETEKEIIEFWKKNKVYNKSKDKNKSGKGFYMMDGPPYATGHIHMGTALNKILKDVAMRSQRLQGKDVFDRAGYDTHGVPTELKVEREIGIKNKEEIEKYGVKKFIDKCKEFSTKHIGIMNEEFKNLGVWMDFENPYLTLDGNYVEKIWDVFKNADKKGLLYLGKYPVHVCPRCETAVSFNEIEYENQEDTSVFVKFPLKGRENTFLVIWSTTPWTLPGNTGIMVHPEFEYQEVELSNGEKWIFAKELVDNIMDELETGYTPKKIYKGKEMKDWEYENPLSKNLKLNLKNAYKVVLSGRYVNLEEGTGLVHCAPGHGKEDFEVGRDAGLDMPCPVDMHGFLTKEAGKYESKKARVVDKEIIEDLEKENYLVYKKKYSHDYPLCWRCKSPLIMISMPQWFFKLSEIQKKLLKENEKTNWIPNWMKLRMKAWLEGISDWPVSRKRYWGTPLPIWECECGERKVIGSKKELEKLSGKKIKEVHKPGIDKVTIKCKCGKEMNRVPDVLDVWFDSGVSSWAALPEDKFDKFWPANLNLEGKDQIRGWWNSQMILSEIQFDKKPFENIIVHGMILDLGKKKMSKSLGNIISPKEIIEKYGRDYMRYYFAKTSKGEDFAYDEGEFKEIQRVFRVLLNINNFINQTGSKDKKKLEVEDKWILSRFHNLVKEVTEDYNNFQFPDVVQKLEDFLINDLSKGYVKIIRDRSDEVFDILNEIRIGYLKLLAPVMPFVTEKIWLGLKNKGIVNEESVHLSEFPKVDKKKIDFELEGKFEVALQVIEKGLYARDKAQIGLKWPLKKAIVKVPEDKIDIGLQEIIKRQLNLKGLKVRKRKELEVELDTEMTPELESEGYARVISRKVQASRKKSGLVKEDKIKLGLDLRELEEKVKEKLGLIKERTNSEEIVLNSEEKFENNFEEKIKGNKIKIMITKL